MYKRQVLLEAVIHMRGVTLLYLGVPIKPVQEIKFREQQAVLQVYLGLKAKMNGKAEVVDTPQRQAI